MIRTALCLGLLGGLTACAVGPDYQPPSFSLPALFRTSAPPPPSPAATAIPATPALAEWWRGFGDPVLDRLVTDALTGSLDLAAAEARLSQARARAGGAQANRLPTLDGTGSAQRRSLSLAGPEGAGAGRPGFERETSLYQGGFETGWELDLFGGLARGRDAAVAELAASEADRAAVRVALVADVARTYIAVRGLQQRLAVQQRTLDTQAETRSLAVARVSAGLSPDLDVAQADALLAATRATLPPLETELVAQTNRLAVLLGKAPGEVDALVARPAPVPVSPSLANGVIPADLLRQRPDLRRAERQLAAANARIGVAMAEYFPRVSLSGSFGVQAGATDRLSNSDARFWSIGPALRWRLFDFGRIDAEVAERRGAEAEALARYRLAVLTALEEVETSLATVAGRRARLDALDQAVAAGRRSLDLAEEQYRRGIATFLAVLEARRALDQSEADRAAARQEAADAAIAAFRALGGGWEREG